MSRRAQITGTTAEIIIIGLAVIILFMSVGRWSESIQTEGEIKSCQLTIATFTTATKATLETLKPKIRCPAPHLDFTGDLEADKRQVAELVRTCWAKTNRRDNGIARTEEGRVREILGFEAKESFCILCSSFTLDKTILVDDLKEFMASQTMIQAPSLTYKEFLDTSWQAAGADPLENLIYSLSKPGAVPLPGALIALDGASQPKSLDAGTMYYLTSFSKQDGNTVVLTSQADAARLACDRFLQQRDPGTKLPQAKT